MAVTTEKLDLSRLGARLLELTGDVYSIGAVRPASTGYATPLGWSTPNPDRWRSRSRPRRPTCMGVIRRSSRPCSLRSGRHQCRSRVLLLEMLTVACSGRPGSRWRSLTASVCPMSSCPVMPRRAGSSTLIRVAGLRSGTASSTGLPRSTAYRRARSGGTLEADRTSGCWTTGPRACTRSWRPAARWCRSAPSAGFVLAHPLTPTATLGRAWATRAHGQPPRT